MSDYVCPSCKSDNVQRLAVVYEGGLSDVNTKTSGVGVGFGRGGIGVGVGGGKTKGTSQTAASKRAAPPPKKKLLKPLGLIFVVFLVLGFMAGNNKAMSAIVTIFFFVAAVGWIVYAIRYNISTWPVLKQEWENSFLCNRCNHVFPLPQLSST
jgi:hypothetical protein